MARIKDRFHKNLEQPDDWDIPTEVYTPELPTINTELVTKHTVNICARCGYHNHLKDHSCIKCDRGLI